MAKLLTEKEYNALIADRERLEWMIAHNGKILKGSHPMVSCNIPDRWVFHGDTAREAIDKARGAK